MHKVFLIHGPNLGLLGRREPEVYGAETLKDIHARLVTEAEGLHASLRTFQSDVEGEIVRAAGEAGEWAEALIINPGAYSHTSVAIMDAMKAFPGPVIEVHMSNVHAREPFRRRLLTAMAADAVISGAGAMAYTLALLLAVNLLRR